MDDDDRHFASLEDYLAFLFNEPPALVNCLCTTFGASGEAPAFDLSEHYSAVPGHFDIAH